jgi:pyruvate kinase
MHLRFFSNFNQQLLFMKNKINRTKIIATMGPASISPKVLESMIRHGVNVCRINASHGDYKFQEEVVRLVRSFNEQRNLNVAILYDLQGPKLRIGEVANNEIHLDENASVTLTTTECIGDASRITIRYINFYQDVQVGDTVLIDDGKIELQVSAKLENGEVTARVIHGGVLSSKKGVNLPYTKISLPSLTEKDRRDLEFALDHDVEWIGLSFVRSAKDITELKDIIRSKGKAGGGT